MLTYCTPEEAGISSAAVLRFYQKIEERRLSTHSVMMLRGDQIFSECYYAPFHADFKHRLYSVSKSFVAVAIGYCVQDGLLSLSDPVSKFFSEYITEKTDERMKRATVLDLLRMSSALEGGFNWFKMEGGRTSLYFDRGSNKEPGALFSYDSSGSYMLGIIVERLTGMDFLTYLRGKCLDRIGFSKDSCCLSVRGGGAWGDSGVMATLRDLALFARFVMMGGAWEGEQLIDPDYIAFITDTSDNATSAYGFEYFDGYGYGGQFWGAPRGGYAMLGMGNQFAFCLPERDFIFVVHSDNQGSPISGYQFLFDAVCDLLVDNLSDEPLPPDPRALAVLKEHTETRKLFALTGKTTSPMADAINGKTYIAEENRMGIRWLRVELNGDTGVLHYENKTGVKALPFGLSHNVFGEFPEEGYSDLVGGIPAPGHKYASATSAAWVASNQLYIRVQIIDKYFGNLAICMGFVDDRLSVRMVKCAEAFLDEYEGLLNARVES